MVRFDFGGGNQHPWGLGGPAGSVWVSGKVTVREVLQNSPGRTQLSALSSGMMQEHTPAVFFMHLMLHPPPRAGCRLATVYRQDAEPWQCGICLEEVCQAAKQAQFWSFGCLAVCPARITNAGCLSKSAELEQIYRQRNMCSVF